MEMRSVRTRVLQLPPGVDVINKGIAVLPDTAHKLGITAEPARMYVRTRIHDEHIGKVG